MSDYLHFGSMENLEPVTGALYRLLQQMVAARISSESIENAAIALDPEILAIAAEEEFESADSEKLIASLDRAFVSWQARENKEDIDPLVRSARLAAVNVFDIAPDPSRRQLYAQTGLSSYSCDSLGKFAETHQGELRSAILNAGYDDLEIVNRLIIDSSLHLPEAQTTTGFAGDIDVLLRMWLQGSEIYEIASSVLDDDDSAEQLSRYIEELFGYRLPWIISGLFRISRTLLGITDQDASEYIRCYPSMVKHGLPDPVASWAMSAGIPTRSVAMRLAEGFGNRPMTSPTHEEFVEWLSSLSDDSLRHDYGISGNVLDDLRYKLGRMIANPFLRPIRPVQEVLPVDSQVVGISYENRRVVARRVGKGDVMDLRRDYENPVDPNAIAVYHRYGQVGFMPRDLAQWLAPEIDAGRQFHAKALSTMVNQVPAITVRVSAT